MYDISAVDLIILILATFRLTHLIVFDEIMLSFRNVFVEIQEEESEDGHEKVVNSVARGTGLRKFIGSILICYWCTGIWSATVLVLLYWLYPVSYVALLVLAVAGAASILETKLYD